jgi:glycosyltransferase involved in cell wall biosynthesis
MSISLCMIVKNEEKTLGRCLNSVKNLADEMVIVDTGSADSTREIAAAFGARVFDYPWDGSFANARNYALEHARMDWILLMDADDEFEREDTQKLLDLTINGEANAYFFQTLSFMGSMPDKSNVVYNMNVRLLKNYLGYRFQGAIHEQLKTDAEGHKAMMCDIRVYHYGYLDAVIREKDKRTRNIALIQGELTKHPDDPFMLFNLGNEYYAMERVPEALECYQKSYDEGFAPQRGYSPKLLVRLMTCYDLTGRHNDMLRLAAEGLRHYPDYTDLEFLRGGALLRQEKYIAAIASLKKCIAMGEAPVPLRYMEGIGSYKSQLLLSSVYYQQGDNAAAMKYAKASLKSNPMFREGLTHMARLLAESKTPPKQMKARLSKLAGPGVSAAKYRLLSDVLYDLRRYRDALAYARRAARLTTELWPVYDEGVCRFYLGEYATAARCFARAGADPAFADRAAWLEAVCGLLSGQIARVGGEGPWFDVLRRFKQLIHGQKCVPLAEEAEASQAYLAPIFSLLEVLLRTGQFDLFDKARGLLNLITDDSVLLRLGKLYFRYGFYQPAYKELVRSIKLTGQTDREALDMMKHALAVGTAG